VRFNFTIFLSSKKRKIQFFHLDKKQLVCYNYNKGAEPIQQKVEIKKLYGVQDEDYIEGHRGKSRSFQVSGIHVSES